MILLAATGIPASSTLAIASAALAACIPASRLVAGIVEKRNNTFTVAGAFFIGCFAVPLAVLGFNATLGAAFGEEVPLLPMLAAVAVCYAMGEGIGRLACISFGCCYGKPVDRCSPWLRRLLTGHAFVFSGNTKKATYEGGFEGVRLVPVQAITAV